MKTAVIEMEHRAARTEAERYAKCGNRLTAQDRKIMRAYKSISRGGRIINLQKTMDAAGLDDAGLPRLAIATAVSTRVDVKVWSTSTTFRSDRGRWLKRELRVPFGHANGNGLTEGWATLPYIPPYIRRSRMSSLFVLWEATWFETPAGDPYLLEKLDENLFRIVAAWDITPLEAAVLRR
jgi:hypothetical protein